LKAIDVGSERSDKTGSARDRNHCVRKGLDIEESVDRRNREPRQIELRPIPEDPFKAIDVGSERSDMTGSARDRNHCLRKGLDIEEPVDRRNQKPRQIELRPIPEDPFKAIDVGSEPKAT
jgi:sporulation-control protein spo0M